MVRSTELGSLLAIPLAGRGHAWGEHARRCLHDLVQRVEQFLQQPVTPAALWQFEQALEKVVRRLGQTTLEWALNQLEPEPLPTPVCLDRECYRLRPKSPRRRLDSLFGPVRLWRYRYEATTPGEPSRFPLEERRGLEARRATPALAERAAWWLVHQTQGQVVALLRRDHDVCWSAATLRQVTQSLSRGLAEHREPAQIAKLRTWLEQAEAAGGPHRPALSVGRDGVMVPPRGAAAYREAATGTVSAIDGHGKRRGTVYLARMPEPGQKTLSRQMTRLLTGLLRALVGVLPRLHYVSDGGHEPTRDFQQVLRKLVDPRHVGRLLRWTRVLDFYHACGYITKISEALYGLVPVPAWARQMRHWLRDKRNGAFRVLHAAAALRARSRRRWTRAEQKSYRDGYQYLRKRRRFMDYASYRRRGLPMGSGITEAACKIVFTQRLKQSGMGWDIDGGQVVVDLRTLWLSGVWVDVHAAYLAAKPLPRTGTATVKPSRTTQKVA